MEILKLPKRTSLLSGEYPAIELLSTVNYSAISFQPPLQGSTQLPTLDYFSLSGVLDIQSRGSCLAIGRASFLLERCYRTVAQKLPFVYLPITYNRLYSLFPSRYLLSNGSIHHITIFY